MSDVRKQVLGRGLSSLLESSQENYKENSENSLALPLSSIEPGLNQPRRTFSESEILALSMSIKEKGILQPIIVRPHPQKTGKYEIVAGERRWRAANRLNLETIPALIREYSNGEALEVGLLENLQRQDLDPIDEAYGYHRLAEEFNHTQETLSRILGKSRSHIANSLRLLTLPDTVKAYLKNGQLSAGHGRAIVGSEHPDFLAEMIISKNLSVRQAETLAKERYVKENKEKNYPKVSDPETEVLRQHISNLLNARVDVVEKGLGGKIVIYYKNGLDLDKIMQKFNK